MPIEPRQAQPIIAAALNYFVDHPERLAGLEQCRELTIPRDKVPLGDPAGWTIVDVRPTQEDKPPFLTDGPAAEVEFDPGSSGGNLRSIFVLCVETPEGWEVRSSKYRRRSVKSRLGRFAAEEN